MIFGVSDANRTGEAEYDENPVAVVPPIVELMGAITAPVDDDRLGATSASAGVRAGRFPTAMSPIAVGV
jgi:hypothetical protein